MKSSIFTYSLFAALLALGYGASIGYAEDAPKDNKGFTASKATAVDLGPEIEGMTGWQLRLRLLTIEPGGHIGLHSHKDRPAVIYLVQGTDVITLADGSSRTLHAGDTGSATKNTTHWQRNVGTDDAVLIAVDVVKATK